MKFDKKSFLDNLNLFMAKKSIKSRTLEEAAGVSKGYISRLKKQENQSIPGIDFLLTAASMFGISVEALCTIDFSMCSDNESYYINFLDNLLLKTVEKKIVWKNLSSHDMQSKIDSKSDEELIIERGPSLAETMSLSLTGGRRKYKSTFDYGDYEYENIQGEFYYIPIDSGHNLYMVKVGLLYQDEISLGIEMFMTSNHNKKSNVCCVSPQSPQKYDALLFRLYETVRDSINVNIMDNETKSVIDRFMK